MSDGELMTADEARAWRDDGVDGNHEEITRLCDTIIALHELLGAAARGELPRCRNCPAFAHVHIPGAREYRCDACFDAPNQDCDLSAWPDLPHAAALRAAMGGAK